MLFTSLEFLVLLTATFSIYWHLPKRGQTILLLVASYVFYGWWDWRFLGLIVLSSIVDFVAGSGIFRANTGAKRRCWLGLSLGVNLGVLGLFKYFDFFSRSLANGLAAFGYEVDAVTLDWVLPVGISFYTFQTLSYTIDIYRGSAEPHGDLLEFFTFVAFFPQLVAGPIERAQNLLGQFGSERSFDWDDASNGLRQILWGLFKKVVIADTLATYVDAAYSSPEASGSTLL
ncbi:MAG: MBOAT family protein, partial [Polyangiales bacterium]